MANTRYERVSLHRADLEVYLRFLASENSGQMEVLRRKLVKALKEDVTDRQRQVLFLYYVAELNMRQIAEALGVDPSTVSRTLRRGEERLRRILRYSDPSLLDQTKSPRKHR